MVSFVSGAGSTGVGHRIAPRLWRARAGGSRRAAAPATGQVKPLDDAYSAAEHTEKRLPVRPGRQGCGERRGSCDSGWAGVNLSTSLYTGREYVMSTEPQQQGRVMALRWRASAGHV